MTHTNFDHFPTGGRRSSPQRSPYHGQGPLPRVNVTQLQEALAACDVIDRAHDKPDERPVATCRFRLLSKDVRIRRHLSPATGKNRAQRARLQAGFTASQCKQTIRPRLPV